MPNQRINLVVAHAMEAKPLCDLFGLKAQAGKSPFPLYQNDGGVCLIVTGMGKLAAAAGTAYLAALQQDAAPCAWLNIGIAGHQSAEIGAGLLAHKITDAGNGNTYYPPQLLKASLTTAVITVDEPEKDYPRNAAYGMEAAGFYGAASRFMTTELIQVFKVISDNPHHTVAKFHVSQVDALLRDRGQELEQLLQGLDELLTTYRAAYTLPEAYQSLLQKYRFTATQRVQLQRLCERFCALDQEPALDTYCSLAFASSKELLAALTSGIAQGEGR